MFRLFDLPVEIFHLVLSHLAHISIRSVLASRGTCKVFETNIQKILKYEIANLGHATYALLQTHFPTILDSSAVPSIRYPGKYDRLAPLRNLPWAANSKIRERWLRPEATWRRLPLASANGAIVRKMQVVSTSSPYSELDSISGYDVMFPRQILQRDFKGFQDLVSASKYYGPPQSVTLGWLYDFIVCERWRLKEGWEMHFGIGVRDRREFRDMGYRFAAGRRDRIEVEEIRAYCEVDEECAVLIERKSAYVEEALPEGMDVWGPEVIDEDHAVSIQFC
ncbi:hypothetical protein HBI92_052120 [Parastagonospora nodorum]|nr:hypothetical protein HBI92_052120 [Parastagonospora nodorum]